MAARSTKQSRHIEDLQEVLGQALIRIRHESHCRIHIPFAATGCTCGSDELIARIEKVRRGESL